MQMVSVYDSRKRQREESPSRCARDTPASKRHRKDSRPTSGYDNLSTISLTHAALKEFNRQTALEYRKCRPRLEAVTHSDRFAQRRQSRSIKQFAREEEGGLDLRSLRGVSAPT